MSVQLAPKHDFRSKLLQESVIGTIRTYVAWRQACSRALAEALPAPEMPAIGLISINLDLTTACNYACDHCVDFDNLNTRHKYLHEELMSSLAGLIDCGLRSVILIGGGEPTIYPHFEGVVRFLKGRGVQIGIVSNGSNNHKLINIADVLTKGDWVRLSLDSGTNETFVAMHKPKKAITLEAICVSIPELRRRNPYIGVGFSFIVTWEGSARSGVPIISNIHEIVTAAKLAHDSDFTYFSAKCYLTRKEDGGEVMDPSVMTDQDLTVIRIRRSIEDAKAYETPTFKVLESTNLRVLENGTWRNLQRQPEVCHMTALRQVLSPLGVYNCPAHRGNALARIAGPAGYAHREGIASTRQMTTGHLADFDASIICREITCLYNPTNRWIDGLIKSGVDPATIQGLPDTPDFFL